MIVYAWYSPKGQLLALFRDHPSGERYLEYLTTQYHSHTALALSQLETWWRYGVSPFVQQVAAAF